MFIALVLLDVLNMSEVGFGLMLGLYALCACLTVAAGVWINGRRHQGDDTTEKE